MRATNNASSAVPALYDTPSEEEGSFTSGVSLHLTSSPYYINQIIIQLKPMTMTMPQQKSEREITVPMPIQRRVAPPNSFQ